MQNLNTRRCCRIFPRTTSAVSIQSIFFLQNYIEIPPRFRDDTSNREATVVLGKRRRRHLRPKYVFKFRIVLPHYLHASLARLLNSRTFGETEGKSWLPFSSLVFCSAWPRAIKHPKVETRTRTNKKATRKAAATMPLLTPLHPSKDIWQKRKKIVSRSKSSKCDLISS